MSIKQKLFGIISQITGDEVNNEDIRPVDISNWDSLNHLRIIVKVNESFEVQVEPEDLRARDSIKNLINIIERESGKG